MGDGVGVVLVLLGRLTPSIQYTTTMPKRTPVVSTKNQKKSFTKPRRLSSTTRKLLLINVPETVTRCLKMVDAVFTSTILGVHTLIVQDGVGVVPVLLGRLTPSIQYTITTPKRTHVV